MSSCLHAVYSHQSQPWHWAPEGVPCVSGWGHVSSEHLNVLIFYKDSNLVKKGSLKFREKHLEVEQEDDNTAEIKTINKTAENYVEMETSSEETEYEITVMKKTIITLKVKTAEHKITGWKL